MLHKIKSIKLTIVVSIMMNDIPYSFRMYAGLAAWLALGAAVAARPQVPPSPPSCR